MSFLQAIMAKYNITADEDKPLYHVTYLKNLSGIAGSGLVPKILMILVRGGGYSGRTIL